jgi:phage shock protein C
MARYKPLRLDRENRKFLGVCAGLANYLEVEPWSVRLVFIGCMIFGGWFLLPLYFATWFLLDDASSGARSALTDNLAVKHFRTVDYKKKIYRNTRDAKWLGVCAGFADYLEVSVFAVRMVFILLFIATGGFPLIFYLAAWMVLDKQPDSVRVDAGLRGKPRAGRINDELQAEPHSKRQEFKYCARKFINLQTRLARMEAYVTSSRFKLHREFRNIS